jgi:hypothetical protein
LIFDRVGQPACHHYRAFRGLLFPRSAIDVSADYAECADCADFESILIVTT